MLFKECHIWIILFHFLFPIGLMIFRRSPSEACSVPSGCLLSPLEAVCLRFLIWKKKIHFYPEIFCFLTEWPLTTYLISTKEFGALAVSADQMDGSRVIFPGDETW